MREIKCRGKLNAKCFKGKGKFIYGSYIKEAIDCYGSRIAHGIQSDNHYPQSVDPETVGQFTGLKDKNGKEIYEGDVILFTFWWFDGDSQESNLTGQIVYSEELMSFQLKGVKNKDWQEFTGFNNDDEYLTAFSELNFEEADFQVLGNIHENPELLEVSK